MAEISAADVMKLRKMSGQGMMDCKKALSETAGDVKQAMELLRKKGLATLAKRAERDTSEGLVISAAGDGWASLVTLCCETDFVAKSDDFIAASESIKKYAIACKTDCGAADILEAQVDGKSFSEIITETVSKTGEKMVVGDYTRFHLNGPGLISTYIHFNGKVGAMVQVDASDETVAASEQLKQAANDIAMHITATKPLALNQDGIDAETIEQEKAIFANQVKGKPENIIEKIIEGKLNKFFAENCLLAQPFVKDDSKTVAQVVEEAAKNAGGQAEIKKFVRFSVG